MPGSRAQSAPPAPPVAGPSSEQPKKKRKSKGKGKATAEPSSDEQELGARRAVPCLGCARSALSGCSNGACHDQANPGRSKRCARCAHGHKCDPLPAVAVAAANELIRKLETGAPASELVDARSRLRARLAGEEEEVEERGEPSSPARSEVFGSSPAQSELGGLLGLAGGRDDEEDEDEIEHRATLRRRAVAGFAALLELAFP